jgi:hypothetical protein
MALTSTYSNNWFDDYANGLGVAPGQNVITASNASAIVQNTISPQMLSRMNIDEMNHLMKGEMVTAGAMYGAMQREDLIANMTETGFKEHVKRELCSLLVKEMMKNNLIEFTMSNDPGHIDYIYRARAYVMPDHMTKILREFVQRNT